MHFFVNISINFQLASDFTSNAPFLLFFIIKSL